MFDIHHIAFTLWGYGVCWIELLGFVTGLVAIFLAGRGNIWTFWIGLFNCTAYFMIFYQQQMYSLMLLQMLFFGIDIYGIICWRQPGNAIETLKITRLTVRQMALVVVAILIGGFLWGSVVVSMAWRWPAYVHQPPYPYLDALLLVASVLGQLLLTRKKMETWAIWVVVDLVSTMLWFCMRMYLTGVLYGCYLILAINAWRMWRKAVTNQSSVVLEQYIDNQNNEYRTKKHNIEQ